MTHGAPVKKRQNGDVNDPEVDEYNGMVKPPDGGWGWMVVFASFAIHIVTDGMTYSFGMFYVEFLDYFNEGKGYTAWIASILVGVTLCSGPVSSAFVNRYGCRPVTIAGAFLGGICLIISCFAQNVFTLFITIGFGAGLGFGLIYLPAIVSVTMYFEKYRSLATGIAVCGSGFGTMVFAPITETLISNYGWRGALLIISGIVFNCAIFGAMFRPLEHEKKKIPLEEIANGDDGDHTPNRSLSERIHRQKKRSVGTYLTPTSEEELTPMQRSHSLGHGLLKPSQTSNDNNNSNGKLNAPITEETHRLAVSQPLLNSRFSGDRVLKRTGSGIMYKKDVFYRGSIHSLHRNKSKSSDMGSTDGHRYGSVHQIPTHKSQEIAEIEEKQTMCGCIPCSPETKDTLNEMLHFGLLKDPVFIIFTVSNFLTSIGFNIPYVYIAAQAEVLKLTSQQGSYLLAIIGIANTVGRIILGYFSDKPYVNRLLVYNLCLTICGIACALSIFCYNFVTMGMYAAVFGCTIGAYVGLTSVILVDLLGLDKLTNAFGILLLFQGIASFAGPPIAGSLYDFTGKYEPGFLLAGASIGFSGIVLFCIPPLQRYLAKKQRASNHAQAAINL